MLGHNFMKIFKLLICIFVLFISVEINGQKNDRMKWISEILNKNELSKTEYKKRIIKYNFRTVWTNNDNTAVFGFIGTGYQRLRIKILSISKVENNPDKYFVSGKSMVKNNICDFSGTIKITNARIYKNKQWGVDDEYKNKGMKQQGIIFAEYHFAEDKNQKYSGVFQGNLATYWYVDKNGKLKYDNIRLESDDYNNNQFVGTWKSNKTGVVKPANWGDYRIPLSGDLDGGAGEFSPVDKYLQFGWQTYRDAYSKNDEQARLEERKQWWR